MVFLAGQSGNPGGRPAGAKNRLPLKAVVRDQLAAASGAIIAKVIEDALAGNAQAQRLCFERILPAPRERTVKFKLGAVANLKDISAESQRIMQLAAAGKLKPDEAEKLLRSLSAHRQNIESSDLETRLDELESAQ